MNWFDEFKKAWADYPSQDNEGYVPDRGGFKCGFASAWNLMESRALRAESRVKELERVNALYREALEWYADKSNWDYTWHEVDTENEGEAGDRIDFSDVETHDDETTPWIAGKRARTALSTAQPNEVKERES